MINIRNLILVLTFLSFNNLPAFSMDEEKKSPSPPIPVSKNAVSKNEHYDSQDQNLQPQSIRVQISDDSEEKEDVDFLHISNFPVKNLGSEQKNFDGDLLDLRTIIENIKLVENFPDSNDEEKTKIINKQIEDYEYIVSALSKERKEDSNLQAINVEFNFLKNKYNTK